MRELLELVVQFTGYADVEKCLTPQAAEDLRQQLSENTDVLLKSPAAQLARRRFGSWSRFFTEAAKILEAREMELEEREKSPAAEAADPEEALDRLIVKIMRELDEKTGRVAQWRFDTLLDRLRERYGGARSSVSDSALGHSITRLIRKGVVREMVAGKRVFYMLTHAEAVGEYSSVVDRVVLGVMQFANEGFTNAAVRWQFGVLARKVKEGWHEHGGGTRKVYTPEIFESLDRLIERGEIQRVASADEGTLYALVKPQAEKTQSPAAEAIDTINRQLLEKAPSAEEAASVSQQMRKLATAQIDLRTEEEKWWPPREKVVQVKKYLDDSAALYSEEKRDDEIDRSILALLENSDLEYGETTWREFNGLAQEICNLDWGDTTVTYADVWRRLNSLKSAGRVDITQTNKQVLISRVPISTPVSVEAPKPLVLEPSPSDASEKQMLALEQLLLQRTLKGNKYLSESELTAVCYGRVPPGPEEDNLVLEALHRLQKKGKALSKKSASGNSILWKKPLSKPRKPMKNGQWKKMIVDMLDAEPSPGRKITLHTLQKRLRTAYPDACNRVENLHGAVGSALHRLLNDKKFKRIRCEDAGTTRLYWTVPLSNSTAP
jgi:hypothetical protein